MTNQEKIIASAKHWNESEDESLEKWDKTMIDAFGKERLLEIRRKQHRNEGIMQAVKGIVYLSAIAILCVAVLYLR